MIVRLTALHRAVHEGEVLGARPDQLAHPLPVAAVQRQAEGLEGFRPVYAMEETSKRDVEPDAPAQEIGFHARKVLEEGSLEQPTTKGTAR